MWGHSARYELCMFLLSGYILACAAHGIAAGLAMNSRCASKIYAAREVCPILSVRRHNTLYY